MLGEMRICTLGIDLDQVGGYKATTMLPSVLRPTLEASPHVRGLLCRWAGQLGCPAHSLSGSIRLVSPDMSGCAHG